MAVLKLGSRYNKTAKRVVSTVNQDGRIDEKKVAEYDKAHPTKPFWGTDDNPTYKMECWIPYLAAGNATTKEEALRQIGDLIDMLAQAQKADGLLVESNGDVDPNTGKPSVVKRYEGAVLGSMSAGDMAERNVLAGAEQGVTPAAYVCNLVKDRLNLNHQQEANGIMRKVAIEDARSKGLLKAKGASAGRTRSDDIA